MGNIETYLYCRCLYRRQSVIITHSKGRLIKKVQKTSKTTFFVPKSAIDNKLPPKQLYILHKVFITATRNPSDYVFLKAKILKSLVGEKYRSVLDHLIAEGWIETDGQYIAKHKSYGFRLGKRCKNDEMWFTANIDRKLAGKLRAARDTTNREWKEKLNGTPYKRCAADIKRVTVDYIPWDQIELPDKTDSEWTSEERLDWNKYKIRILKERAWAENYPKIDNYGRFHTLITNISNALIGFLRLDKKEIIGIDISNSQPVFLSLYINNNRSLHSIGYYDSTIQRKKSINPLFSSFEHEISEFQKLVCSGQFYEDIGSFTGFSRADAKQAFFTSVYGPRLNGRCGDYFKDRFPGIAEFIQKVKSDNPLVGTRKWKTGKDGAGKFVDAGYTFLACEMQRVESRFMFYSVVPRIHNELDIPLLTKHDSVLVNNEYVEPVKNIMSEEFSNLGIDVHFKIENYSAAAAS